MAHDAALPVHTLNAQLDQCARVALLLVALCGLAGCAGKTSPTIPPACQAAETLTPACFTALYARYSPLLHASVQVATGLYLQEHPARAEPLYTLLADITTRIGQQELTTLTQIEALVRDRVQWDALPPATQLGAQSLLTAVRAALEGVLQNMGVQTPAEVRLVAVDVVTWAKEAVAVQCPICLQSLSKAERSCR